MKVIVDDIATEYADQGTGPVFLMLHGWGDSLRSFDALVERLGDTYRIVRLDLPGFGNTELPKGTWYLMDYARFVQAFCIKIGIEPDFVAGHSFGGRITIKSLAHGLLTPKRIVLIGSAGVADRPTFTNAVFTALAKTGKVILRPFPRSWYERLRRALYDVTGGDYVSAGALSDTFVRVINEDLSVEASQVKVPTLLIWGEDDIVTPPAEGRKFNRLIQGSELHVLGQSGHFVHQQRADDVVALIRKSCI